MSSDIVKFLIDLIIQPGASLQLVPVINIVILILFIVLFALSYTKIATIHLIVMGFLAIGLLLSVNWVCYEFQKINCPESALQIDPSNGDKKTD